MSRLTEHERGFIIRQKKTLPLDLNGIWIKSPPLSMRFQEVFSVPVDTFLPALKDVMTKVRMPGAGDAFVYWEPYLQKWGVDLSRDEFFRFWFEVEKEVPEVTKLILELKERGMKIFVLSNNFSERSAYYKQHFPFLEQLADKIYYSWQTGLVKPDPKAYELVLKENSLNSSECVYYDDSQENVTAASEIGIDAHVFTDINEMRVTTIGLT